MCSIPQRRGNRRQKRAFYLFRVSLFMYGVVFSLLLSACAPLYFQTLPVPTDLVKIKDVGECAGKEFWHGFVFNGEKVGFMYFTVVPDPESGGYRLLSEAHLRIRFMGMVKHIDMKSNDLVSPDLSLRSFSYEQNIDGKILVLHGKVFPESLVVHQKSEVAEKTATIQRKEALYPSSAINLYPFVQGFTVGTRFRFDVYDPQTQSITEVSQEILSYETSPDLGIEPSFKVKTHMHGHTATSWINRKGETLFEMGMGGVLLTYREEEEQAKRYLVEASLNRKDVVYDFSLVRTKKTIPCPRQALSLKVALRGLSGALEPLRGQYQDYAVITDEGKPVILFHQQKGSLGRNEKTVETLTEKERRLYLSSSHHIEVDHPEIRETTAKIIEGAATDYEKVERLVHWVSREVIDEAVDSFSAIEVLRTRKGECQAHTLLYVALARAAGVPTKLVGGLVYMEGEGFLYHSWAESFVNGWIPVDPTFDQVEVDATHIKLVEGPDWTSLFQIGRVIGKISIEVLEYACTSEIRP